MKGAGPGGPVTRRLTICNEKGLHARAAAKFVTCVAEWDAQVTVEKDGASVTGDSIMGLMMLAASKGTEICVTAEGQEAEQAIMALGNLVSGRFDEGR